MGVYDHMNGDGDQWIACRLHYIFEVLHKDHNEYNPSAVMRMERSNGRLVIVGMAEETN